MVRKLLASLLLGLSALSSQSMPLNQFDSLVMFGDSLTDNGNLYAYMWGYLPISPPYYQGHFSNGPIWAEYLYQDWYGEQNVGGFQDYAVGGAGAVISRKGNLPFTLSIEVDDYLYWHTHDKPTTSLFAIWIGANNYLNGPSNVDSITTGVVNAIGDAVETLARNGGNKFLVANLPDLNASPFVQKYGNPSLLKEITDVHNRKLADKIDELRGKYPDIKLIFFDVNAAFEKAMADPAAYHLTNVTDPCYFGTYSGWYNAVQAAPDLIYSDLKKRSAQFDNSHWEMIKDNPELMTAAQFGFIYNQHPMSALEEPSTCYGYLFWDHIHPTTEVHRVIADEAKKLIKEAGLTSAMPDPGEAVKNKPFKYDVHRNRKNTSMS
jgi:phospholipase/lecithinase/hemolysin